jgi:50S ribosomal subunit-associated GTPase HflX
VPEWCDYILQNVGEIVICLAANKSDKPAAVDINEVFQWAEDHQIAITRTSAVDGETVDALFESVARELEKQAKQRQAPVREVTESVVIEEVKPLPIKKSKRKRRCC